MEATTGFSDAPYETMESNDMKDTKVKQMKYKMDSHWCCGRAKDFAVATLALLGFLIAIIALILSCYNMYVLTNKLAHLEGLNGSDSLKKGPTVTASGLKSDVTSDTKTAEIVNSSTTDKSSPTTATTTVASSSTTTLMPTTSTEASTSTTTPLPTTSTAATTTTTPTPKTASETSPMNSSTTTVETTSEVGTGVAYTRWGRGECGTDSQVIYRGFVAGSVPSSLGRNNGGGANYLCMPEAPDYNRWDNEEDNLAYSWVQAAKFLSFEIGIFDDTHHGEIPKCSLCHSPRSAKVMIPAKRTCPSGWTKEYEGYLMSSASTQAKSTFECFDETPDVLTVPANRTQGTGGAQLYFASGSCSPTNSGQLPFCPPYISARELTCVICTK